MNIEKLKKEFKEEVEKLLKKDVDNIEEIKTLIKKYDAKIEAINKKNIVKVTKFPSEEDCEIMINDIIVGRLYDKCNLDDKNDCILDLHSDTDGKWVDDKGNVIDERFCYVPNK